MLFTLKGKVNEFPPPLLFVEGTKFSSTMGMNPVAFIVHYLCLTIKPSLAEQPPPSFRRIEDMAWSKQI